MCQEIQKCVNHENQDLLIPIHLTYETLDVTTTCSSHATHSKGLFLTKRACNKSQRSQQQTIHIPPRLFYLSSLGNFVTASSTLLR